MTRDRPSQQSASEFVDEQCILRRDEWRLALASRVNILFIGREDLVAGVVDSLRADLGEPIDAWHPGSPLVLPSSARERTLILHQVGALTTDQQRSLGEWLAIGHGRARIFSTASQSLQPLIAGERFSERLYYRLNTLLVKVSTPYDQPVADPSTAC